MAPGRAFQALVSSLSLRLLVPLLVLMSGLLAVYGLVNYRSRSEQARLHAESFALRTGDLIRQATHLGMMLNREDELDHIVRKIGETPGVHALRVYDKNGVVQLSARQEEVGRRTDLGSGVCAGCHQGGRTLRDIPHESRLRQYRDPAGLRLLALLNPIRNQPDCANARCHAHPAEQTVLGVLEVQMSLDDEERAIQAARRQTGWATLAMVLLLGTGTTFFVHRVVRRPVGQLQAGTRRIASGDLQTRIAVTTRDELGHLAEDFNRMTEDLQRARAELTEWSRELERKVVWKTQELGRVERQAQQMEKMASLGRLAATVAHELNNPLTGVLTYARLVERTLAGESLAAGVRDELKGYLSLIQRETARCGSIVRNLLVFARGSGVEMGPVHLRQVLERTLMLVRHRLELASIQVENRGADGDDLVWADAGQLEQALVALLINAVEAMEAGGGGVLRLGVRPDPREVEIEVADTGVGIPEEALPHIFDPFFSTKDKESGVGLGLAVVYGIVQRHEGSIQVESRRGAGTRFRIRFPRRPAQSVPDAEAGGAAHPARAAGAS